MHPLSKLKPPAGAKKAPKRVGRGQASGTGQTAGRGTKGQRSRSGRATKPGFEGGQMPLQRRLPKRGFTNIFRKEYTLIQIRDLARFDPDTVVDLKALCDAGMVKSIKHGIKVLGTGEIDRPLTVKAQKFSKSARQKIEAAGGKAEVV